MTQEEFGKFVMQMNVSVQAAHAKQAEFMELFRIYSLANDGPGMEAAREGVHACIDQFLDLIGASLTVGANLRGQMSQK